MLQYKRNTLASYVWRSNNLMRTVLKWKPHGKRSLGRPIQRWIDKVKKDLAEIGIRDEETLTQDKERWRYVYVAVMGVNGL